MTKLSENDWYQPSLTLLTYCLLPISWLFRFIITIRKWLYTKNLIKTVYFPVHVIVVGNITVGGTGKTPFVIWLAQQLRERGYQPGIVSRGVGGKQHKIPYFVTCDTDVKIAGDEAILLAQRTQCPLMICIDRVKAVKEILSKTKCNIIISDDGLQHYRLGRSLEIVIVDGSRGFGNKQLLPAGPLREPLSRLKNIDFIIYNQPDDKHKMIVSGATLNYESMWLLGDEMVSLKDKSLRVQITNFKIKKIHAVAAIGNPQRFFNMLREKGFEVIEHSFPDHSFYQKVDFDFGDDLPIIMTEKDAMKCQDLASAKMWFIPVEAKCSIGLCDKLLSIIR